MDYKYLYNIINDYLNGDILIDIIEKNIDNINWKSLNKNPSSYNILQRYPDKKNIHYYRNSNILCIETYINDLKNIFNEHNTINTKIIDELSINNNDIIVDHLLCNINKINIENFNMNTNDRVLDFLEKNEIYIRYCFFCKNANKKTFKILRKYIEKNNIDITTSIEEIALCMKDNDVIDFLYTYLQKTIHNKYLDINEKIAELVVMNESDKCTELVIYYMSSVWVLNEDFWNTVPVGLNTNKKMINYIEYRYMRHTNTYMYLASNKNALHLFNFESPKLKINWRYLSSNKNFWDNYSYNIAQKSIYKIDFLN